MCQIRTNLSVGPTTEVIIMKTKYVNECTTLLDIYCLITSTNTIININRYVIPTIQRDTYTNIMRILNVLLQINQSAFLPVYGDFRIETYNSIRKYVLYFSLIRRHDYLSFIHYIKKKSECFINVDNKEMSINKFPSVKVRCIMFKDLTLNIETTHTHTDAHILTQRTRY